VAQYRYIRPESREMSAKYCAEGGEVNSGDEYVYAAYGVVLFALLLYVVVVGLRSARTAREAELMARLVEREVRPEADGDLRVAADPVDATRA
jgi:hypothetical protein